MRCAACDCKLSDFESTRKSNTTGEYFDLCNKCFFESEVADATERADLDGTQKPDTNKGYDAGGDL